MATLSSLDSREGFVIIRYPEKLTKDLFDLLTSIAIKVS